MVLFFEDNLVTDDTAEELTSTIYARHKGWFQENGCYPEGMKHFKYYWVVDRQPICVRPLVEKYITIDCIGYRAYEFLDGKLVRPEAIKVIQMTGTAA